jgi:hypothetical protein
LLFFMLTSPSLSLSFQLLLNFYYGTNSSTFYYSSTIFFASFFYIFQYLFSCSSFFIVSFPSLPRYPLPFLPFHK